MRIDAHQHFWCYDLKEYEWIDEPMSALRRDFLPRDLEPELKRAGFDACVAVQARQSLEETRWLLELAASVPFIYGVVGWVDLCSPDVPTQLAGFAHDRKLLGVRHVVQGEPDDRFLLRPEFLRGIAALEKFALTYDILIYPRHLPVAAEFVQCFPRQRFVLDHLAKPPIRSGALRPWSEDLRRLVKSPNVFCKLSGLVTEADWSNWTPDHLLPYLDVAMDSFGPERLMIGSDWPVCTVAAPYLRIMEAVTGYLARFSEEIRDAILGGNAQRFWSLRLSQAAGLKSHGDSSI